MLLNAVLASSSPFHHPAIQQTTAGYKKEMCYNAGISAFKLTLYPVVLGEGQVDVCELNMHIHSSLYIAYVYLT